MTLMYNSFLPSALKGHSDDFTHEGQFIHQGSATQPVETVQRVFCGCVESSLWSEGITLVMASDDVIGVISDLKVTDRKLCRL